jgi:hypothetical protein
MPDQFDADIGLLLSSPISKDNPGTRQERKELLGAIFRVTRGIFGDRHEANKYLLEMSIAPEFPSNFRAAMDYRSHRQKIVSVIVVGIT